MSDYVYAQKGNLKTRFTRMAWATMGKDKNGWQQISGEPMEVEASNNSAANEASTEAKYRQLYEQAKGFATDGKNEDALAKYKEAQALKDSPSIKGVITKLENTIKEQSAANEAEAQFTELVEAADQAYGKGEYGTALEMYQAAQEVKADERVAAQITACEEALA